MTPLSFDDLVLRLALALGIGLVVGIERGWRERDAPAGSRTAGIRTYTLTGFLGGIFGALAQATAWPLLVAAGFLAFSLVFAWFKRAESVADGSFSVTGTVAAMLVFALGALAILGDPRVAAAGGVLTALVLASRENLHGLLTRVTWLELRSALLLLAMTAVVLPLLPNRALDPFGGFNPREVWLFTILVATLSYAGYIAIRLIGPDRGVLITGLVGGLVSSTALTIALARRAKAGEDATVFAAGAALAGTVSVLRVVFIASVVQPALLVTLAPAGMVAAAMLAIPAILALRSASAMDGRDVPLGNPFEFLPVFGFALLLAVLAVASAAIGTSLGTRGLLPLAAVSGLFDVDAITLSTVRLVPDVVTIERAAQAILLAVGVNTIARIVYAVALGPPAYARPLALVSVGAIAAGLAVLAAMRLL